MAATRPVSFGDEVDTPAPARRHGAELVVFAALAAGAVVAPLVAVSYRAFDLDRFFVPKELTLHATGLVATLAALVGLRRMRIAAWDAALLAWLALSLASAAFAANRWLALRALAVSFSSAAVFWAGRRAGAAGYARPLAAALAVGSVAAALTSLAQAYGVHADVFAANRAPGGTLGNRNFVAHLSAAGLPLVLWLGVTARSRVVYLVASAALVVSAAALVLSRTRAAWLAVALWVPALVVVAWRGPTLLGSPVVRRRASAAALAVAAGILAALVLPNTLEWRSESPYLESVRGVMNYREGSGAGRVRQYTTSLRIAAAHPVLGVGPGNWPVTYPAFARGNDGSLAEGTGMTSNPWPSSDWVAALSERGAPGALALGMAALLLLGSAWRARRDPSLTSDERLAALAGGSVLFIAVVEGAFDAVLLLAAPALLVWPAVGALVPAARLAREVEVTAVWRRVAIGLVAVVGAMVVAMTAARVEAMRLYSRGTLAALEDAARLDPGSYRIRLRAAQAWAARGECRRARPHALAARALFPHARAPGDVLARCR